MDVECSGSAFALPLSVELEGRDGIYDSSLLFGSEGRREPSSMARILARESLCRSSSSSDGLDQPFCRPDSGAVDGGDATIDKDCLGVVSMFFERWKGETLSELLVVEVVATFSSPPRAAAGASPKVNVLRRLYISSSCEPAKAKS